MSSFADGAALFDLRPYAAAIRVAGTDARDYLQRMISADLRRLDPEHYLSATIMTAKGRLVAAFELVSVPNASGPEAFRIWCDPSAADPLVSHLERFVILEDVQVDRDPGLRPRWSVQGPKGLEVLAGRISKDLIPTEHRSFAMVDGAATPLLLVNSPRSESGGWDLWCSENDDVRIEQWLTEFGATTVSEFEAEAARVDGGYARFGVDADAQRMPPEAGYDDAVSYDKGCYVGQEVVARIRTYGHVNWLLRRFRFETDQLPEPGAAAYHEGEKKIGTITSAALSLDTGRAVALGYVRYEIAEPGTEVEVEIGGTRLVGVLESLGRR